MNGEPEQQDLPVPVNPPTQQDLFPVLLEVERERIESVNRRTEVISKSIDA